MVRRVDQSRDPQTHRSMARTQDIDAIDLDRVDNADRPSNLGIGHQIRINLLAQFRRKLFGVVQPTMTKFFRKNHRRGHNRTCEGAAASFINTCNPRNAGSAQSFLVTKSASPAHAAYYAEILNVRSEK